MGRLRSLGLVLLLAMMLDIASPGLASRSGSLQPAAPSFTLQIAADRTSAERNDTIAYTLWLNVTGGGQLQLARVNLTLEPDLSLQIASMTYPADCARIGVNATFAEWQCSFLRSGRSYRWSTPALVDANASQGRSRTATARAAELGGGAAAPQTAQVGLWIVLGVLALDVSVDKNSVPPGGVVFFVVNVTNIIPLNQSDPSNEPNVTAYNVRITIGISPFLEVGSDTPRFIARDNLTPSEPIFVNITGIVRSDAVVGNPVWVNASLIYADATGHSIGPRFVETALTVGAPAPLGTNPLSALLAVSAFAVLVVLVAIAVAPMLGERKLVLDEVFLMHRSGLLIQHLSRGPGLRKDDDLVASMFVAIQEFVRDSFQTKATLDELSFAGRKAAVLRGTHIVLAALLSRGSPRYLFPQMKAVERAFEKAHGAALEDWDGRVARLSQARPILQSFIRGGYRRVWGWRR